ncbi:MAG: hypothetical protein Q8O95_02505 [bacterium]|nr:hypothetical protein [bacterium]
MENPLTSAPKIAFFEGTKACKQAYSKLLDSSTEILEFATHEDLVEKFGKQCIDDFIKELSRRHIIISSICHETPFYLYLKPFYKKQFRRTKFIPQKKGQMYSCIALYEDKLLMMNLGSDPFGILIENAAIVETMKTIHDLAWNSKSLA